MKMLKIFIGVILILPITFASYPTLDFRSVSEQQQNSLKQIVYFFSEHHYKGIPKIIVYGKEMWGFQSGWFLWGSRVILIDKSGVDNFKLILEHELLHNKCYSKQYNWDKGHDSTYSHYSQCFKEGLI